MRHSLECPLKATFNGLVPYLALWISVQLSTLMVDHEHLSSENSLAENAIGAQKAGQGRSVLLLGLHHGRPNYEQSIFYEQERTHSDDMTIW